MKPFGLLAALLLLGACAGFGPPAEPPSGASAISLAADADREAVASRYDAEIGVWRPEAGFAILSSADEAATAQSGALRAWSGGVRAWGGGVRAWGGGTGGTGGPVLSANAAIWTKIGLDPAHTQLAKNLGDGVVIAVIDTGLDLGHPAFRDRLTPRSTWFDFVDNDTLPQEVPGAAYGHGTAVASIALQVAPGARVLPLRVLGADGSGRPSDVAAAIDRAVTLGADVVQLSLGTPEPSEVIDRLVAYATAQGVYVVTSAGNSDANPTYPAFNAMQATPAGAMTVGVGSVDLGDVKSWFSNFVPETDSAEEDGLEMVAFGEDVVAAAPGNKVASWDGTSMAAPMIAGALALAVGEGAETRFPGQLGVEVIDESLEIDASGTSQGLAYELEQRLEVGLFLCEVLGEDEVACAAAYSEAAEDGDDEGDDD